MSLLCPLRCVWEGVDSSTLLTAVRFGNLQCPPHSTLRPYNASHASPGQRPDTDTRWTWPTTPPNPPSSKRESS